MLQHRRVSRLFIITRSANFHKSRSQWNDLWVWATYYRKKGKLFEDKPSPGDDALVVAIIIARVVVMLVLWLGIFMAIFLGYFYVPVLLVGLVIGIYMISDLSLFVTLKRRRKIVNERQEFIKSLENHPSKDE